MQDVLPSPGALFARGEGLGMRAFMAALIQLAGSSSSKHPHPYPSPIREKHAMGEGSLSVSHRANPSKHRSQIDQFLVSCYSYAPKGLQKTLL
jgi:hypothetical protein